MHATAPLDPPGFFRWLAACTEKHGVCIECGAGSGELSAFMRGYFSQVVATDANPLPNRSLRHMDIQRACAESIPAANRSVDLLFSMQALHFFDLKQHLAEAARVLRKGGVFAALGWGEIQLPADISAAYEPTFRSLAPHWEPERAWLLSGYAGVPFKGLAIPLQRAYLSRTMTLETFDAEIAHWSATQTALIAGADIQDPDDTLLMGCATTFTAHWPIVGQVYRVDV